MNGLDTLYPVAEIKFDFSSNSQKEKKSTENLFLLIYLQRLRAASKLHMPNESTECTRSFDI